MKKMYFIIVFAFCFCSGFTQAIVYVDSSTTYPTTLRDGRTWRTAFKEVTEAFSYIKSYPAPYTLYIAKGTYRPSAVLNKDTCFLIDGSAISMLGGFPSGGGSRDLTLNPTILSGNLGYDQYNYYVHSHHIIIALHIPQNQPIVFDGITITGGNSDNAPFMTYVDGEPIRGDHGPGIFLYHLSGLVTIRNCTFVGNDGGDGGGLYVAGNNTNTKTVVQNCNFQSNNTFYGGSIRIDSSFSFDIAGCTFLNSVGNSEGGGIYLMNTSTVNIKECNFISGFGGIHGGAIASKYISNLKISSCVFKENFAGSFQNYLLTGGGAISNEFTGDVIISNCLFYKNHGVNGGAIINKSHSNPLVVNCHFVDNVASKKGGAVCNSENSTPTFDNCIIWGNTANSLPVSFDTLSSVTTTSYSLVQGGYAGAGNINTDPKFINATDPDGADNIFGTDDDGLRPQDISPAINRGNNSKIPTGFITDIAGDSRIQGKIVDMGAYESPLFTSVVYVDINRTASGHGFNWANAYKELRDAMASVLKDDRVDSILIAKGIYKPTINTSRDSAIVITRGGLKIYGGYPTGGGTRNPLANPTILSGEIGAANNSADNSYHVLVMSNIPSTEDSLVIDGFTITKGNANGTGSKTYNEQSFNRNDGAGVSIRKVNNKTVFRNCTFTSNVSTGNGGAVFNYSSSPSLFNCLLAGNKAAYGGAIANETSSAPLLTNCTLARDTATTNGGGMYNNNNSNPLLTNSIIWDNTAATNNVIGNGTTSNPQVNTSIVQTTIYFFGGNLNMDPLFVNAAAGNFQLQGCSPGINAGNSAAMPSNIITDLLGNARVFNTAVDIGAYENVTLPTTFTFKGVGNWTIISNWQCNWVPPSVLPSGSEIIIDPTGGDCKLNIPYTLSSGGKLTVKTGKKLVVQ